MNRSWDTLVQSIKVGKKVVVTQMSMAKLEGKLLGINADSITVERDKQPRVVQREGVFRVRYADIRKRHTLYGMAIGATSGFIGGAAKADSDKGLAGAIIAAFGVGVGSAVGGALPIGPPLYQAEKPVRPAASAPARK